MGIINSPRSIRHSHDFVIRMASLAQSPSVPLGQAAWEPQPLFKGCLGGQGIDSGTIQPHMRETAKA